MKKIVIYTGSFASGGAEKQSMLLAKALNSYYDIVIISHYGEKELGKYIGYLESNKIVYYQLKGGLVKKIINLYRLLKSYNPEVIINYLPSNNVIGGMVAKILGVPKIIGNVRSSRQSLIKYFELLISHKLFNTITVFNNNSGRVYFSNKGFLLKDTISIENCLDPMPCIDSNKKEKDFINVVMVSRFEYYKDYDTAIKSFSFAVSKIKNLRLIIVGTGSLQSHVESLVEKHNLVDVVEFQINPENIDAIYTRSDIFLQTSIFEGFSNSIMEAMSYALPVIATDVGDNAVLIQDNFNGYLLPVKDPLETSERIIKLAKSTSLRESMGCNGRLAIESNYTIDIFLDKYMGIL